MTENRNYLLGSGERLTRDVNIRGSGAPKKHPYTIEESISRIQPMVQLTSDSLNELPMLACPNDEVVTAITLHPTYIAKSYFPMKLFSLIGLRSVGSRAREIVPAKHTLKGEPKESTTTQFYVAGKRADYARWENLLTVRSNDIIGNEELREIEDVSYITPESKVKKIVSDDENLLFEIVLHSSASKQNDFILDAFEAYLNQFELKPDFDSRLYAGGLCFVKMKAHRDQIDDVSLFSFIRIIRQMPSLRTIQPFYRSVGNHKKVELPRETAIDPSIKVAVFDGGIPEDSRLDRWVQLYEPADIGDACDEGLEHGQACTSALLFGSLKDNKAAPRPYANIDHYRVLDKDPGEDPNELYEVLKRIDNILSTNRYDFINFSIGPYIPVEDPDVHAWTAILDEHLSEGETLATIAVGNNGESDSTLNLNRIQVPSDCVNGLSVGACNSQGKNWERASYSAIGPGRSPGLIKPDVVGFGGDNINPFKVLDVTPSPKIVNVNGTSYAAPEVLRAGLALRAYFGAELRPLAIKALLIHTSESSSISKNEIGWGRVIRSLDEAALCPDGMVRVVYQGVLKAKGYLRAEIPTPLNGFGGKVNIKATFCYSTLTDPAHPNTYTRSGLEVFFRPHEEKFKGKAKHAKTDSFFKKEALPQTENVLRGDAQKWETCIQNDLNKNRSSLKNPVFDIHYIPRAGGQDDTDSHKIKYALVITVSSPGTENLYDKIVARYPELKPLVPATHMSLQH